MGPGELPLELGTAWPIDMITYGKSFHPFMCIQVARVSREAQTNRAISNGESESFDASRFSLSRTVAWTVLRPSAFRPHLFH